jgi:hypothetical protein
MILWSSSRVLPESNICCVAIAVEGGYQWAVFGPNMEEVRDLHQLTFQTPSEAVATGVLRYMKLHCI